MRQIINPVALPAPRGFSHAVKVSGGELLFLAGQDASDRAGNIVAMGDIVGQLDQVLSNLQVVVESAGGHMRDIVKLNIFVASRDDYIAHLKPLGEVFRRYFDGYYPALALFQVAAFFREHALIELEGMAVVGSGAASAEE